MKAVMYHYIRPGADTFPGYYHLSLEDFRKQLSYFREEYGFVEKDQFLHAVRTGSTCPSGIVLTFDDGLLDHYEHVLPELRKRDLWGIFYISTGPHQNDRVLDVHRIHALLGQYSAEVVLTELLDAMSLDWIDDAMVDRFETYAYRNQDESAITKVKRILNYYMSVKHRSALLEDLQDRLPEAMCDVSDFYMSNDQLRSLDRADMIVGSHSVTHRVLSKLQPEVQRDEIVASFEYLRDQLGELSPRTFCYPYGGDRTFTDATVRILEDINCDFTFNVESRDITVDDLSTKKQTLPRYDCNEFRHGQASGAVL